MIERLILGIFQQANRLWKIDGKLVEPNESDILEVLDKAAEEFVANPEVDVMTVGGIKIERNERGRFDVYVFVGEYL